MAYTRNDLMCLIKIILNLNTRSVPLTLLSLRSKMKTMNWMESKLVWAYILFWFILMMSVRTVRTEEFITKKNSADCTQTNMNAHFKMSTIQFCFSISFLWRDSFIQFDGIQKDPHWYAEHIPILIWSLWSHYSMPWCIFGTLRL